MSRTVARKTNYNVSPPTQGEPTTYRVQRLLRAPDNQQQALASQVFGGAGLGLSKDAWKLCQSVFDFDYMGAAEYEFGAIPAALRSIIEDRGDYEAWSFVIKGSDVTPGFWRQLGVDSLRRSEVQEAKANKRKPPRMTPKHRASLIVRTGTPAPDQTVYVVSHKEQGREVVERLIRLVQNGTIRTKNGAQFDLDPEPFNGRRYSPIGWFDLDNEILWFTDKAVFEGFTKLFEVGQSSTSGSSTTEARP